MCLRLPVDTNDDSCAEYGVLSGRYIGYLRLHVAAPRGNSGRFTDDAFRQYLKSQLTFGNRE